MRKSKDVIYEELRRCGKRVTAQKRAILDILLDHTDRMLSVVDIKSKIPHDMTIDDATIYRNVQSYEEMGILESMIDSKGLSRYIICDSEPHHHMICTECGKIINFPCTDACWQSFIQAQNFEESYHKIEVYGRCQDCQR